MRGTHIYFVLLLTLSLSPQRTGGYGALDHTPDPRCLFGDQWQNNSVERLPVVREIPVATGGLQQAFIQEDEEPQWLPIRIMFFTFDLRNSSRYCTVSGTTRPNYRGGTAICTVNDILTDDKKAMLSAQILPQATKMHADRLLIKRRIQSVFVPTFRDNVCNSFTIPVAHRSKGVNQTDMILYVASGPSSTGGASIAQACATLSNGRPIIGAINFAPGAIVRSGVSVRMAAHEIAHVLGFNYNTMKNLNMITRLSNIRGKSIVTVVNSTKVLEVARTYYGCDSLAGVELEDGGGRGVAGSHWERRIAMDDLMAVNVGLSAYSVLTMAFFEDTGFYKVVWEKGERMVWGRNAGCEFINEKCVTNNRTKYPNMFCTEPTDEKLYCTYDRQALGHCTLKNHKKTLRPEFQYFGDANIGGSDADAMDFCPIIAPYRDSYCTNGEQQLLLGSRIGPHSRCIKGDGLQIHSEEVGDVCAEVQCSKGTVSLRYVGDDKWYACPEGGYLTPTSFSGGRLVCPKWEEVCYDGLRPNVLSAVALLIWWCVGVVLVS
ncbi:putative Leishmanolysin [Trypanosoma vivax]|uniref:Leishmanolysin-like peptidase n=1 Tax=Trypanosoma vivax (strain Y486) TaxID=1055687 RepID=G0UBZ0_TRYVY|nr:putative peptidase M8 [Trypanosoma vivax]KAH8609557.1 putative Leishmanolysin [Trypanosoma vivax]CCC53338.1 putative peptidase M8 [Trypanosoma vivax Y486]